MSKYYDERNNFKTNVRGIKVRGVFQSKQEADARAVKLHRSDSNFHVFVGQVGYWLPFNPCADNIEDEHFGDDQLNNLMQKYKEICIVEDIQEIHKRLQDKKMERDKLISYKIQLG